MKHGVADHPKLLAFARRAGLTRRDAVGLLELLWDYTATYARRGDLGRFTNSEIAAAVDWNGKPRLLIEALVNPHGDGRSGWLDPHPECRFIVHDWPKHAPDYVKKDLSRQRLDFVRTPTGQNPDKSGQNPPVKGSQGKSREGNRERSARETNAPPDNDRPEQRFLSLSFPAGATEKQRTPFINALTPLLRSGAPEGWIAARLANCDWEPWKSLDGLRREWREMSDRTKGDVRAKYPATVGTGTGG